MTMWVLFLSLTSGVQPTGFFNIAQAKDLGVHGKLFAIAEENALSQIQNKLKAMEASGELAKLQQEWQDKSKESAYHPKQALPEINSADQYRVRYFDPSITVQRDLRDHRGVIFAKKGTKVNPFDKFPHYQKRLVFIDGDREEQVKFALIKHQEEPLQTKIILVKGSPIKLMEQKDVRFYFDQQGQLVRHFKLGYFPTYISREGNLLKIEEVVL